MRSYLRLLVQPACVAGLLVLGGCQAALPVAPQNSEIASLTQRINQLESGIQNSTAKIATTQTTVDSTYQQQLATVQQQRQQAADAVYAATQANQQNPQQNAYTTTVAEALQAAAANLGGSDAQGMQNAATQLKLQLAGSKSDLAQLQAMHDAQLKTAAGLQQQLTQEQQTRSTAETQLAQLQSTRNQLQSSLQTAEDARNQAQTTLAQKLEAENQNLANDAALKRRLMFYLVAAGALAGLAAAVAFRVYPPIGLHLALASGGFFLAAYLVAEIQPWMVFLIIGLSIAAIIWAVVIRHRRLSSIADSALGAIQQLKMRAEAGDTIAAQAYEKLELDLKNHLGAQANSLESEAKKVLDRLPWVSSASAAASTPTAPPTPPPASTPSAPIAAPSKPVSSTTSTTPVTPAS